MVELCNCPMLDSITPLMSWSNTPIGTPRRTPLPTPHGTPLITPRATPRCTPRGTPRATPTPMSRMGYNPGEYRSPSRTSMLREEDAPPPRRRFVQAPEIFSSFSSKQVSFATISLADLYSLAGGRGKHGGAEMFHILRSAHHDHLGEGRGPSALQQPHLLVGENRSSCTCHPKLPTLNKNSLGVRTMLLHCAKPGDSGTYRITITNSSGTASCSASLSVRSGS